MHLGIRAAQTKSFDCDFVREEELRDNAYPMDPAHRPGAPRKDRIAQPGAPPFECLPVGAAKRAKLRDGLKKCSLLAASHCKRGVAALNRLKGLSPPIGGELTNALCAKHIPVAIFHLLLGEQLLAFELPVHRVADRLITVALLKLRRHRERELDGVGPLWTVRIEVCIGAPESPRGTSELLRKHHDPWPLACTSDEPCFDRIGHHICELFQYGLLGQQPDDGGPLMVPDRAFPFSKRFRAERHQPMKTVEKIGKPALGVGQDQVFVRRHKHYGMHYHIKLTGAERKRVEVKLSYGRIGAKEMMTAKRAACDHDGATRQDEAGLGHKWEKSRNEAIPLQ